ncbi:MAG: preprotein translocase subunit SecA [Planctomycetes bacterium]|nr:preprotein translocase subunit SecA [Planctomycetota bacterium]
MDWEQFTDKLSAFGEATGRKLKDLFGSRNERVVRTLEPLVTEVAGLEEWAKGLSAEAFKEHTARWKAEIAEGKATLDDVLPKAFALVREASRRTLGLRHFDVQIVGGIVLHRGAIAEMSTGEGKTLVATLPLYLNCLEGKPVYLVTVNDYLARRDCAWMKPIYDYLGVSSGAIQSQMGAQERQPIYAADIVYGTNNEFGFDYLRDNMKLRVQDQVQRFLHYAIVDEVDSILIDEARTPLIISGPAEQSSHKYAIANAVALKLEREKHYEVKEKERQCSLLEAGIEEAEKLVGIPSFYTPGNEDWPHFIENALRAKELYQKDREYVVEEGEVVIVDEFTGRKMVGRRWSDGLHQAVETKEGLPPRQENQTLATITFQNYFRLFKKLAGMTGTAITEATEFHKIYHLDVVSIPTNLPIARKDHNDVVYRTEPEKWKAIADEIAKVHEKGQPLLIGTTSVEKSEKLAALLRQRGIKHEVLNAKNHEREANIIAHAGEKGAVTVATNMAGRGTDIKLGGNFEWRLRARLAELGLREGDPEHLAEIDRVREAVRAECQRDEAEVLALGGLYVLGTERHEARRIDNQLRGRSGRQGNSGTSRFFLSLEDDLMRRFYRDWVKNAMERLGMSEGQEIESRMVTRAIEKAQRKVEDYNFEIRKSLLEYDEVMDKQRKTIYSVRQEVLEGTGLREKAEDFIKSAIQRSAELFKNDAAGFQGWFQRTFGLECPGEAAAAAVAKVANTDAAQQLVSSAYDTREKEFGVELMRRIEQYVLLNTIDGKWKDHLYAMDSLKTGIGLRGYGQVDPKNEYKREGFALFQNLQGTVEDDVASVLMRIQVQRPPAAQPPPGAAGESGATSPDSSSATGSATPQPAPSSQGPGAAALPQRREVTGQEYGPAKESSAPPQPPPARRPVVQAVPASNAFDVEALRRRQEALRQAQAAREQASAGARPASKGPAVKVDRNDPCPCGSGKKYKKCHGAEA